MILFNFLKLTPKQFLFKHYVRGGGGRGLRGVGGREWGGVGGKGGCAGRG